MQLATLLGPDVPVPGDAGALEVTGLASDSRKVRAGDLFAALAGTKAAGEAFIADAVGRGAVAVLAGEGAAVPEGTPVPVIRVPEPRRVLALAAARFFERQPKTIVAVTGTSGKTSVAEFTRQIFAALGHRAASLGTIGVVKPEGAVYGSLTTPDPISLHETLAALADEGITHLAMEASSHGLDQFRLDGVRLAAAAFTNLGRDHLDYHPTLEAYLAAKIRLIRDLLPDGGRVVANADDPVSGQVGTVARARGLEVLTVGRTGRALKLEAVMRDGFTQTLAIVAEGDLFPVRLPLVGAYQAANALVAAGLAIATGEAMREVLQALETLTGVKGRLEIVGRRNDGLAVVDYAHKPEALAAALDSLRPFATGRLICVFGCGGDRDRGKRPIMGEIAVKRADVVIVTDDNPRTEQPQAIRAEILAAAPGAREIGDRREAIQAAVRMMQAGDVVVVAGKGHETGQIIGDTVIPFSDQDELAQALAQP